MDSRVTDMFTRTEWPATDVINDGDVVACKIDGKIVECAVRIHPKEICVRLLRDDIGMTASAKLMLMAPVTYTTETGTRKANDYGIMRLRERIKGLLPEYLSAKEDCKLKIADLNIKKRDLKKDFKEGRLPQKSYMEQLSGIKDEMFAHQRALTETFAKVFNQILSECSHCDNLIGTIESL